MPITIHLKDDPIKVIDQMIRLCEPIKYSEFNKVLKAKDKDKLRAYEKEHPEVGLARYDTPEEGISTLSIIATLSDLFYGHRLAFIVDESGYITGAMWANYSEHSK